MLEVLAIVAVLAAAVAVLAWWGSRRPPEEPAPLESSPARESIRAAIERRRH